MLNLVLSLDPEFENLQCANWFPVTIQMQMVEKASTLDLNSFSSIS